MDFVSSSTRNGSQISQLLLSARSVSRLSSGKCLWSGRLIDAGAKEYSGCFFDRAGSPNGAESYCREARRAFFRPRRRSRCPRARSRKPEALSCGGAEGGGGGAADGEMARSES